MYISSFTYVYVYSVYIHNSHLRTYIYIYLSHVYIYRLKAGGSPELRGTLSLDAILERTFVYTDGWGGCNNVMWSALDDVESWKMLLGWKMLLRCKFRCCFSHGAVAPANCFKQPLWTWRWKRCVLHFVHGSPVHYHMFYFWTERPK